MENKVTPKVVKELYLLVNHTKNHAQFVHWFAQHGTPYHNALGKLYDGVDSLDDSLMESVVGCTGVRINTISETDLAPYTMKMKALPPSEMCEHVKSLKSTGCFLRSYFSEYPEVQNEIDNFLNILNQFIMLLELGDCK